MRQILVIALMAIGVISLIGCGPEDDKGPPKDYFRAIKVRLNEVQNAVLARDNARIDSLLISSLREEPEGVDSLLSFVYGSDPDFQLKGFSNYQIFHTENVARVDLEITAIDTLTPSRRATFTFSLKDTLWYLKRWEPGLPPIGSEDTTEVNE